MDPGKRDETKQLLKKVLKMERYRRRQWRLLYFRSEDDCDETEFFSHDELCQYRDHTDKPWFRGFIHVYH